MNSDLTHKEYMESITLTKRRLVVGKKYSPYLVNKDLIRTCRKSQNIEGILFLNKLNFYMGRRVKLDKQYHFDYLLNSPVTHRDFLK